MHLIFLSLNGQMDYEAEQVSSKHLRQLITTGSFVSICVAPVIASDPINQVSISYLLQ